MLHCSLLSGPLITEEQVSIAEKGTGVLPCFLSPFKGLTVTGGSWTRANSSVAPLVTLMRKEGSLRWNKTNVSSNKFDVSDKELQTVFNVTLRRVKNQECLLCVFSIFYFFPNIYELLWVSYKDENLFSKTFSIFVRWILLMLVCMCAVWCLKMENL